MDASDHSLSTVAAMSMAKDLCISAVPSLKDDQTALVISSLTVIMTFMVLSVVLRLVSRHLSAARFGPDDYMIVAAMVDIPQLSRLRRVSDYDSGYYTRAQHGQLN